MCKLSLSNEQLLQNPQYQEMLQRRQAIEEELHRVQEVQWQQRENERLQRLQAERQQERQEQQLREQQLREQQLREQQLRELPEYWDQDEEQAQRAIERMREIRVEETARNVEVKASAETRQVEAYEGLTEREKQKKIAEEQKKLKANRKRGLNEQKKIAKMCHAKVEDCSSDGLIIAKHFNDMENKGKVGDGEVYFDLAHAQALEVQPDSLQDVDFKETGDVPYAQDLLDQVITLENIEHFRTFERGRWNGLSAQAKENLNSKLDYLPAYREYMENYMVLHDLKRTRVPIPEDKQRARWFRKYSDEGLRYKWSVQATTAAEKELAKKRCNEIYSMLKAQKLEERKGGVAEHLSAKNITDAEHAAHVRAEKESFEPFLDQLMTSDVQANNPIPDYRRMNGAQWNQIIKDKASRSMLDVRTFVTGQERLRQEYKHDNPAQWQHVPIKIIESSLLAVGHCTGQKTHQERETDLQTDMPKAHALLDALNKLKESETEDHGQGPDALKMAQRRQSEAVERAYEQFEQCFRTFYLNFEERMEGQSAHSREGLIQQQMAVAEFMNYKNALTDIASISPALKARIPLEQLEYLERVTMLAKINKDTLMRMDDPDNATAIEYFFKNNIYGADNSEFQNQLSRRAKVIANAKDVHYGDLPATNKYRIFADRYAESTGLTPEAAFQLARRANLDPSYLEQLPGFAVRHAEDMSGLTLQEKMSRTFVEPRAAIRKEGERLTALMEQHFRNMHFSENDAEGESPFDIYSSTEICTLEGQVGKEGIGRYSGILHLESPDMTDEEKVALYDKMVRIKRFKMMEEKDRENRPKDAPEPENITREREALRQANNDVNQWIKESCIRQINQYSETFGDLPCQMHIMDLIDAVPDFYRWMAVSQVLGKKFDYLRENNMLTEEEVAKYERIVHAWDETTTITSVANSIARGVDVTPNLLDTLSIPNLREPLGYGPGMSQDQMERYIETVRKRYPDLLYGRFARQENTAGQANTPGARH